MDTKAWRAARRKRALEEGLHAWRLGTRKIESKKRYSRKDKHVGRSDEG